MLSPAAAATSSIRPFSNNETLTFSPGVTPRWSSTARRKVTCPFAVTVSSSAIDTPPGRLTYQTEVRRALPYVNQRIEDFDAAGMLADLRVNEFATMAS